MRNKLMTTIFVVLFLLTIPLISNAQEIKGRVTKVLDGDTIWLLPDFHPAGVKPHKDGSVAIRFRGTDAPEKKQPYGIEARNYLKQLIGGRVVKVKVKNIDRYKRIVGYVYLDQININLKMIEAGYAWAYTEYLDRPYASAFYQAEKRARSAKRGLWQQPNPLPPWEWRASQRSK